MCGLQLSPCSFSELAVSLSFPFSVASLYHAGDPTTQEGGKYGYCMDWGDCDQCIDDNKHCLPLGTERWNWECIDDKVHATYFLVLSYKKVPFQSLSVLVCTFSFLGEALDTRRGNGSKTSQELQRSIMLGCQVNMLNCKINGTVHIFFLKKSYLSPR